MAKEQRFSLSDHFLDEWSRTRGPLFEDPRAAVCRIRALVMVSTVCNRAPDRQLRMRAARVLDEALAEVPDSSRPATNEQRARANMALVDINRLNRESGICTDMTAGLVEILNKAGNVTSVEGQLKSHAWAQLLAAVIEGEGPEIQLRAARTLLARTRDAARRVGRPSSEATDDSPKTPPAEEVVHEHVHVHDSESHPTQPAYECRADSPGRGPP
ncbi:MAG: hypothetical protein KDH09_02400 [Chrysiogenetes bacterium]|nr:hypothetical protein [Chrysiogenetes bacterium]